LEAQEDWEKGMEKLGIENDAEKKKYADDLQRAYRAAQPSALPGTSPYRSMMSMNMPPYGMAEGGRVAEDYYGSYSRNKSADQNGYGGIDPVTVQANLRGRTSVAPPPDFVPGFAPEFNYFQNLQQGQAPQVPSYMPPWMSSTQFYAGSPINRFQDRAPGTPYYQNALPSRDQILDQDNWWRENRSPYAHKPKEEAEAAKQGRRSRSMRDVRLYAEGGVADLPVGPDMEQSMRQTQEANARFQNILNMQLGEIEQSGMKPDTDEKGNPVLYWNKGSGHPEYRVEGKPWWSPEESRVAKEKMPVKKASGGEISMPTDFGTATIAGGGIAPLPSSLNPQQPAQPPQPAEEELMMVAAAVTGQVQGPEADQIIEMFIAQYGPETFQAVREMILQQMAPGAQTEGLIQGQGSGMQDMVPGTIGGQQPVAVSPGEFIVPADVVSGLGDGSSDAGAQVLDQMMGNVRQARTGGRVQPPALNVGGIVPGIAGL
jgi:hypothetical protein